METPPSRQRGATLIVGLLFLLVLTLLGAAAMRTSHLELKMSGNVMQKTVSFQESEDAREIAEASIRAIVDNINSGGSFPASQAGMYDVAGGEQRPDVTDPDFWADSDNYIEVNSYNRYVVEYLGRKTVTLDDRSTTRDMHVFRISVLGIGTDGISQTLAQTVFMER